MRLMQLDHPRSLVLLAAHSREIQPGEVVDFDELIQPRSGAAYSLEDALGGEAARFIPAPPPPPAPLERAAEPSPEPVGQDTAQSDQDLPVDPAPGAFDDALSMSADEGVTLPADTVVTLVDSGEPASVTSPDVPPADNASVPVPAPLEEPKSPGRGRKK